MLRIVQHLVRQALFDHAARFHHHQAVGQQAHHRRVQRGVQLADRLVVAIGGKQVLVSSFNAPILVDGQFKGVVGNDLALDFIQGLLTSANGALYEGAGELALIAANGTLIAATEDATLVGQPAAKVLDADLLDRLKQSTGTEPILKRDEEQNLYQLLLPFQVAGTSTRWALAIELPAKAVLAELHQLQDDLAVQANEDTFGMALIGLLVAAFGLLVI